LNGEQVHANNVPRGVSPNQDKVEVKLRKGENRILFKIHNQGGDHGFYFAIQEDQLIPLWRCLSEDYPAACTFFQKDLPNHGYLSWFLQETNVEVEKQIITRALSGIEGSDENLRRRLVSLEKGMKSAKDPAWLDLYWDVCWVRKALASIDEMNWTALVRAVNDLMHVFPEEYPQGQDLLSRMAQLEKNLQELKASMDRGDIGAAQRICGMAEEALLFRKEILLSNPLLDFESILLVKRREDKLGLPQNWQGNCALPAVGYENEIATFRLSAPDNHVQTLFRPEEGRFVGDVDLHFDANKMLFSMPGSHGRWQIWEIGVNGEGLRQITLGEEPDVDHYDACYLPDDRIVFASTLCFQGIPCVGGVDRVANLCLMDKDGTHVRQLCFDQDHNWCPTMLNNGRVLFTRWEYSDTPHYFSRLLFHMNPDGTGQSEFYGSNSYWPNSIFYARPIPDHPTMVVAIVSGHHGVPRMGELVLLDPALGRFEADGVIQRIPGYGENVEPVIMDQLVDHSWPRFLHPYPLSEKYFLVSCKPKPDSLWGIYLVDVFDNMLCLAEIPGYVLFEPIPLRPTRRPPILPDRVRLDRDDGTVYLADVYFGQGLEGVPKGTVKKLRVYEFHYTYPLMGGHIHVGVESGWDVRRILGTVPVYEDGSALFRVPANTPVAVQPLDVKNRAVQLMRSWFVAMPGEAVSCVGCHERQNAISPLRNTLASKGPVSEITPWYGPARGFSFKREVQPVLDKYCVGCHDGGQEGPSRGLPDFTAKEKNGWGNFTPSYLALHPYVRRPGPESDYHMQIPMEFHASTSELVQMLEKGHHGVRLDEEAWDRLVTWIDLNVPDHGTWSEHRFIVGNFHQRRREMRTLYANRPEDPEQILDLGTGPVAFVYPDSEPARVKRVSCSDWPFDRQSAKSRQLEAGERIHRTLDLGDGVSMEMVRIPSGRFVMGHSGPPRDPTPTCVVGVEQSFWMAVFEVTNEQFQRFDPSHHNGYLNQHHKDHTKPGYSIDGLNFPAVRISWDRAMAFCSWLSDQTGEDFTLPTEAQWEWACRAGADSCLSHGGIEDDFSEYANLADVSIKRLAVHGVDPKPIPDPDPYMAFLPLEDRFNDGNEIMCEVGQYQANVWGLHDMHGNAAEWTSSLYWPYPYDSRDGREDRNAEGMRVVRGGSWLDRPYRATSAYRIPYQPWQGVFNVGFRVVCSVPIENSCTGPRPSARR